MEAAGREKLAQGNAFGVSDIMNMGQQYEKYVQKHERDALTTHDINGKVKKNAYGAVMNIDERLINQTAGQYKRASQENVQPNIMGQGRNASHIIFGDDMAPPQVMK